MEIKKVKISEIKDIDTLINDSNNGTAFAYSYFLNLKQVENCLCVYDDNVLLAFMPLFENGKKLEQSTMYIPYGGPILLYSKKNYRKYTLITREVLTLITDYIKNKYEESSFSFDPSLIDAIPCIKNGFIPEIRYTYVINLDNSLESIFNKFGHDRKKNIRKTKDVEVLIDDELVLFDVKSALSWELNYGSEISYDFVKKYLKESIENKKGKCFVALKNKKVIGGVAIVWDNKRCYIMYSYYDKNEITPIPKIYYEIIKYLDKNYLFGKEDLQGLKDYSKNLGIILRKEYVKDVGSTPLRDFVYINSTSYLREHLEKKIEKFSNYDENNLRFNTLKYRNILQKDLPKKFKEKEAYGRLIGALNESFYGEKNSEILEALKRNKIKVSDKNIMDFMNKDHLIYRLVAFNFINSYINKYDSLECNDFHKKVLSLGTILKDIFKESISNSPLYDLITNAKEKELVENPKYKLSKENSTVIVDNSIQISMFDKKDENIR